ncbi:hypothetical protein ACHWQZ_G003415 [Mnemiopsis leidyi]
MSVLVVVTVLEGKQFPSKPRAQLQVTCKFANEVLNSDPVSHTSAPYFNTELAWELTRKTLHQHRLQRTPLKLTFNSKSGTNTEVVGHIMLDLRSISSEGSEYKWYPLSRSKYKTHKPQVRLMLSTEDPDGESQPETDTAPQKLFVSLDEAAGCYQVGEPSSGDPLYNLSLTIIAASHLIKLIDSSRPAAFSFRFNLLDNIITNSSFVNAVKPDFPIERVSVKLRGTLENVYKYLASVKDVSLQLCQGPDVVGVVNVPFTKLLTAPEDADCVNSLHSCLFLQHPASGEVIGEERPSVEIHFTLRQESQRPVQPPAPIQPETDNTDELLLPSTEHLEVEQDLHAEREVREPSLRAPSPPISPRLSPSPPQSPPPPSVRFTQGPCNMWLCNIRLSNAKINKSGKRYIRYVYPYFGSSAPHSTSVIQFVAGDSTPLPPSSCEYSFLAATDSVIQQFSKVPLVLQFWRKSGGSEDLEGTAVISLAALLQGGVQQMSGKIISKSEDKVIGEVQIAGWLDDKGAAPAPVYNGQAADRRETKTEEVPERQKDTYKAALELELWKEMEQEKFLKELELKGETRMKQITAEWKKKELEREEEAKRQVLEYNRLKEKMKIALKDLEVRENQLLEHERKLALSQDDLARERARLTSDIRETSRRVEEEFEHKLSLQKQRLAALDKQNIDLKIQVEEAEARLEKRTAELQAAREAQLIAPSTKMQSQLEILKMEKDEMERKITSLEKAKLHYKESWTKALKELINVRERAQQDAKRRLHHEQSLMEHARLRYLSLEDQKLKEKTKLGEDVENLKGEINKMREEIVPQKEKKEELPPIDKAAVGRLIEERNSLLNTGVYTKSDPLIQELNNKINLLQNS